MKNGMVKVRTTTVMDGDIAVLAGLSEGYELAYENNARRPRHRYARRSTKAPGCCPELPPRFKLQLLRNTSPSALFSGNKAALCGACCAHRARTMCSHSSAGNAAALPLAAAAVVELSLRPPHLGPPRSQPSSLNACS
jgi:hypothetical protein